MGIIPDPVPELCHELATLGWANVARSGAQFAVLGSSIAQVSSDRAYRLGFLVEVPIYQSGPIILQSAVERCGTNGLLIFDYKEAKFRIAHDGRPIAQIAKDIATVGAQALPRFGDELIERIRQAGSIPASLEECLLVNSKCENAFYRHLRIDDILTAHRLASPADRWPMYRRQANTPNTKLNLADSLSEYAATMKDPSDWFDLSIEAGDLMVNKGDLEARPAWHFWE